MTNRIDRIVVGSLGAGLMLAILLVAIVVAGATENVISGAVLVAFGSGWTLLAVLSARWTNQPQRWAALPAAVFLGFGLLLIVWPGSIKAATLEWTWPPVLLGLVVWMTLRGSRDLTQSRTSMALVSRLRDTRLCSGGRNI